MTLQTMSLKLQKNKMKIKSATFYVLNIAKKSAIIEGLKGVAGSDLR